jgi:hypothetical protein
MDIIACITAVGRAVAEVFGYASKRTDLKNAADVKQAAKAQENVDDKTRIEKAVANRDLESLRNDLGE